MYRLFQATLAIVVVGAVLVGPASAAPADTVVGNGTPQSCNESSFDAAVAGGGTITFNCGGPMTIQLTSPASIAADTSIDGGSAITLTGHVSTQLFIVGLGLNLSLENIILDRGFAHHLSGGAILNAGNLSLNHVTIQRSVADVNGGAIDSTGPVSVDNSTLIGNLANSGGALYEESPRPVTIDNSTFAFNNDLDPSAGVGGAIALGPGAQLTMTGGSLNDNQSLAQAGALNLAAGATATFLPDDAGGTTIANNYAPDFGGAISNNGGTLNLVGADLSFNHTLTDSFGYGGAIDDEGAMSIYNAIFNSNQGQFGGAVFVGGTRFNAQADIQHTLFVANDAAVYGGALYANTVTTSVTIEDSNIESNRAYSGGGLARFDAGLSVSKSSITSNIAEYGGGLKVAAGPTPTSGPTVEIRDTTISGNLSTQGYGGGINNSGLLDLINVTLADNHTAPLPPADGAGGLYAVITGTVTRLQNTVIANHSGDLANCFSEFGAESPASAGFNYANDTTCNLTEFHDTQGDGLNPMLGTLTNNTFNSLFTNYQMPLAGSPLIDAVTGGCSPTDQIYALRPDACDIGAVEFGGLLPRIYMPLMRK